MSTGYMRYSTEYVPLGRGISIYTPDRFFALGVAEMLSADRYLKANGPGRAVNVIHFPDHCSLLAWSQSPTLPDGVTVIVGSPGITDCLAPLFDPSQVRLVDSRRAVTDMTTVIQELNTRDTTRPEHDVNEIVLTVNEMAFMWCWSAGHRPEGESKYNSRLKSQVMKKLAVGTDVALLIRFRLMFLLNGARCLLRCRIQSVERRTERPSILAGEEEFKLMVMA